MDRRIQAFLDALTPAAREALGGRPDLGVRLLGLLDLGDVGFAVDPLALAVAMARRIGERELSAGRDPLDGFELGDLALAVGCAQGEPRALALFEQRYRSDIDRAIRKSPNLGISPDEFRQILREKLFVTAPNSEPKIASYGGRAPLSSWLRVTCARTVIDLARRKDEREALTGDEALFDRLPNEHDPELALIRKRYAALLPSAFATALSKLEPRQRNLLRQRYLHGVAATTLAESYGVHRATIFGWIEEARERLLEQVRVALRGVIGGANLDSVIGALGSELDLSIRRLLDSRFEPES